MKPISEFIAEVSNGNVITPLHIADTLAGHSKLLVCVYPTGDTLDNQRAYLFGALIPMIQQEFKNLGHNLTKEEVYQFLKSESNVLRREYLLGNTYHTYTIGVNDKQCTKKILTEFINEVEQFALEQLNITI